MAEDDQQYQKATMAVDDAMRIDVLGPKIVKVLTDHTPANEAVKSIIAKAIADDSDVKNIRKALEQFIADHDDKRKGKWIDRLIWLVGGAAVVGIITLIVNFLSK